MRAWVLYSLARLALFAGAFWMLFVLLGLVFLGTGFLFDRARRELAAALEGESR